MKYFLCVLAVALASPVWAQGKQPEKEKSKSESASSGKSVKDSANDGLKDVDKGIHKAGAAAEDIGNEALGAVDRGVHKVTGSTK